MGYVIMKFLGDLQEFAPTKSLNIDLSDGTSIENCLWFKLRGWLTPIDIFSSLDRGGLIPHFIIFYSLL